MSREVEFEPQAQCDGCGAIGAFDFMGDYFCPDCIAEQEAFDLELEEEEDEEEDESEE